MLEISQKLGRKGQAKQYLYTPDIYSIMAAYILSQKIAGPLVLDTKSLMYLCMK
jgi:hypothetical protein